MGHVLAGLLIAVLSPVVPIYSVIFAAVFVFYQVREHEHLNDFAYADIRELLYGIGLGGLWLVLHIIP